VKSSIPISPTMVEVGAGGEGEAGEVVVDAAVAIEVGLVEVRRPMRAPQRGDLGRQDV